MASKIYTSIVDRNIENYAKLFSKDAKDIFQKEDGVLFHPAEYGRYREEATKNLLSILVGKDIRIADGFVITSDDNVSTQCDIIGYNSLLSPLLAEGVAKMFPAEEVRFIAEIKSNMSKTEYIDALRKMARNKQMIMEGRKSQPIKNNEFSCFDSIVSFLICEKIDFDFDTMENEKVYKDIDRKYWHNAVLSVQNGLSLYCIKTDAEPSNYPLFANPELIFDVKGEKIYADTLRKNVLKDDENEYQHIRGFFSAINLQISNTWIYEYDPISYLGLSADEANGEIVIDLKDVINRMVAKKKESVMDGNNEIAD